MDYQKIKKITKSNSKNTIHIFMAKYKDIDFSFSKNPFTGDLNLVQDSTSIKQSIKNILLTMRGEKSFNYNFGASIQDILFERSSDISIAILNNIDSVIRKNEPRIILKNIYFNNEGLFPSIIIDYEYTLENGQTVSETTTVTTS